MTSVFVPGLASVHSHAFQFALRGKAQRFPGAARTSTDTTNEGSFWSWRQAMYDLVLTLTPDDMYTIARDAYRAMYAHGVRAVGEFHYVHHTPDGSPYHDRNALAHAVIQAAKDTGMRIALLRSVYQRPGFDRVLEAGQRRFIDSNLDRALYDTESLLTFYRDDPMVQVHVAPHSLRAVSRDTLVAIVAWADQHQRQVHMHLSEQPREVAEVIAEYGLRPVQLLTESGLLRPDNAQRWTLVHATHLSRDEVRLLRTVNATLCFSRSTERDLGDGSPLLTELFVGDSKLRLAFGVDGYAELDPKEEARALEFDERTRTLRRPAVFEAPELLHGLGPNGYTCLGFAAALSQSDGQSREADLNAAIPPADALLFAAL